MVDREIDHAWGDQSGLSYNPATVPKDKYVYKCGSLFTIWNKGYLIYFLLLLLLMLLLRRGNGTSQQELNLVEIQWRREISKNKREMESDFTVCLCSYHFCLSVLISYYKIWR